MPSYWYSQRDCIVKDTDTDEERKQKEFNSKICASKKPYFMTYVYPKLKYENDNYIKNTHSNLIKRFGSYGITSIDDLRKYEPKTEDMEQFLEYYDMLLPVGYNPCVVNRISWYFESYFKDFISNFSKMMKQTSQSRFDYSILKSGVVYSRSDYQKVYDIYREYNRRIEKYQQKKRTEKIEKYDDFMQHNIFVQYFKDECFKICPNSDELCDIVIDICYKRENSKQFAWDICAEKIIDNLLKRNDYKIHYPVLVSTGGEFVFNGNEFVMNEKVIENEEDNGTESDSFEMS